MGGGCPGFHIPPNFLPGLSSLFSNFCNGVVFGMVLAVSLFLLILCFLDALVLNVLLQVVVNASLVGTTSLWWDRKPKFKKFRRHRFPCHLVMRCHHRKGNRPPCLIYNVPYLDKPKGIGLRVATPYQTKTITEKTLNEFCLSWSPPWWPP